ncbi:Pseudouridine-metabolizing bifunctional protein [Apiospora phragmitis]|uniref:Pseudouridine-metabolizing bifunctional protein n=1 Tax=Apiospora phragmitis TaxID=2905665 RepID=A0ABR1TQM5_9PEZI
MRRSSSSFSTSASYRSSGQLGGLQRLLKVSEEVTDALATNKPVVALESTIYTHGALGSLDLEDVVRQNGGVPAVVGILEGVPTVGLTPAEVAHIVENSPRKVSRRDIAYLVGMGITGKRINGGTTIAGTTVLARLAGIRVFGTGGLGGVHRGGENTMDVSADLTELGRTRMAVISSGCKGFLDIPRTLEYLETQGVLVSTFADGRKGDIDFPAFWARDSGTKSPFVVQTEEEAAAMILAQESLGIESGLLFANPIPEESSIPRQEMDAIIEQAVAESLSQGAQGSLNTPFILGRIRDLTNGRSVPANKDLVRANVERAAKIALATMRFIAGDLEIPLRKESAVSRQVNIPAKKEAHVIVAGSVAVDLSCNYAGPDATTNASPHLHTSNPAQISQSIGGVGRNVALAAHRVSGDMGVRLCSMVGNDVAGTTVLNSLASTGMDTSCIRRLEGASCRTAQYVAVNDANKNLVMAMADMDIFAANSDPAHWASVVAASKPKWLVVDANWSESDIRSWIKAGKQNGASVAFEPVSNAKSARLFCPVRGHDEPLGVFPAASVDLATPNQHELAALHAAAAQHEHLADPRWFAVVDAFAMFGGSGIRERFVRLTSAALTDVGVPQQAVQLLPYVPTLLAKLGDRGALLVEIMARGDPRLRDAAHEPFILSRAPVDHPTVGGVYMRLFPVAQEVADVVSVNGVGDTFLGVLVAGLARGGRTMDLVDVAQKAAVLTLRSSESVSGDLGMLESELVAAAAASRRHQ